MLRDLNALIGYRIHATDGEIGKVDDFYFDDETWTIRYMVVDTGQWLSGRKVLISPLALRTPNWSSETFPVQITKEQVRSSPDIDTQKPISRQHESEFHTYYSWPVYWGYGMYSGPIYAMAPTAKHDILPVKQRQGDPRLCSTRAVLGYRIHASDGELGHLDDYIVDDEKWTIRFLVVDTSNGPPGRRVLISPNTIQRVDWVDATLFVNILQQSVISSPDYDPFQPVGMDSEGYRHDYCGRCIGQR
jgi:sporulation protein YlmC with PRC-barrel domain